jgi:hypothetical protein
MAPSSRRHTAGIFDVRNIIGGLLGIYGVVLVIAGLVDTSAAERDRAAGLNANLWTGVVLVLVSAFFISWALIRPTVVDDVELEREKVKGVEDADDPTDGGSTLAT